MPVFYRQVERKTGERSILMCTHQLRKHTIMRTKITIGNLTHYFHREDRKFPRKNEKKHVTRVDR